MLVRRIGWMDEMAESAWLARCLGVRDRLLSSPRFQRWATAFPLTRPIAQRRARALFDLCAGFVYSQILLACVRLRLFDILAEGQQPLVRLSERLSLSMDATARLLRAAVALRLVEHRGETDFGLGALGAALVGNPGVNAMVEHHATLYADLYDPLALLRGERHDTELGRYWPYAGAERPAALAAERVAAYTTLMSTSQPLIANEILAAYPLARHHCLLDIGGGDGAFIAAVGERAPKLRFMLFDLPAVAERAEARFARAGLSGRAVAVGGDWLSDPLPEGADIAALVRVIHDHDDTRALAILRAARRALPADGTLLLAEPMSATSGAEPVSDAYFGFYLLAMGCGRPRSVDELKALLWNAGFGDARVVPNRMPMLTRVVVARPS